MPNVRAESRQPLTGLLDMRFRQLGFPKGSIAATQDLNRVQEAIVTS